MNCLKKIFISLCFLHLSLGLSAQEPYFAAKEGSVLEYLNRSVDGELRWKHIQEVKKVWEDGRVEYTTSFMDSKGEYIMQMGDAPIDIVVRINNGDIEYDMSEVMASIFKGIFKNKFKVKIEGGKSVLPANMKVGDKLADINYSVRVMGMKLRASVTDRYVDRVETITTPAGEFDCIVLKESRKQKGMTMNQETFTETWYSKGVGVVRVDTYDKKRNLEFREEIVLFKMPFGSGMMN